MTTPKRWVETVQFRKSTDGKGKVRLEVLVVATWPPELHQDKPYKGGKLVSIDMPDGPLKNKLINLIEHPERTSPRWRPLLQIDPKKPPEVGDVIYFPTAMSIDHGQNDIAGGLATVKSVERTSVNGGTWAIEIEEHRRVFYWDSLAPAQGRYAKEYKKQWARADPDDPDDLR